MIRMSRSRLRNSILLTAGLAAAAVLPGCLERRLSITSEPPGALVWVNDVELGRTPVEADFTFYGEYDVRVRLEGYEPIQRQMTASQPLYEYPPIDLVAGALPVDFENTVRWHFDLEPSLEKRQTAEEFEKGLLERARGVREQLGPAETAVPAPEPTPADSTSPNTSSPDSAGPDSPR